MHLRSEYIENKTADEISPGDTAVLKKVVTEKDIALFAAVSGDVNPAHLDLEYAEGTYFKGVIAHGMLTAGFISAVLGTQLPGPGAIYLSQFLEFKAPVRVGDEVRVEVAVQSIVGNKALLSTNAYVGNKEVVSGVARVMLPQTKVRRGAIDTATIQVQVPALWRV